MMCGMVAASLACSGASAKGAASQKAASSAKSVAISSSVAMASNMNMGAAKSVGGGVGGPPTAVATELSSFPAIHDNKTTFMQAAARVADHSHCPDMMLSRETFPLHTLNNHPNAPVLLRMLQLNSSAVRNMLPRAAGGGDNKPAVATAEPTGGGTVRAGLPLRRSAAISAVAAMPLRRGPSSGPGSADMGQGVLGGAISASAQLPWQIVPLMPQQQARSSAARAAEKAEEAVAQHMRDVMRQQACHDASDARKAAGESSSADGAASGAPNSPGVPSADKTSAADKSGQIGASEAFLAAVVGQGVIPVGSWPKQLQQPGRADEGAQAADGGQSQGKLPDGGGSPWRQSKLGIMGQGSDGGAGTGRWLISGQNGPSSELHTGRRAPASSERR